MIATPMDSTERQSRRPVRRLAAAWRRGLGAALGAAVLAGPLAAQSQLCLERDGKFEVVRRADRNTALVQEDGKWVRYDEGRFVMKPMPEYLPVLIAVENPHFGKGERAVSDDGPLFDTVLVQAGRFVFTGELEAPCALDNVVLALGLTTEHDGNQLLLWGVGHLDAHEARRVSIDVKTPFKLRGVRLHGYHLYVDGRESLNTHMRAGKREAAIRQMVASRLLGVQDAAAKPFMTADPVHPSSLRSGIKGHAVVRCRVGVHGEVEEPGVKEATDPAFGAAALEAVKEWRFVPAVKGGVAVESEVEVPLDF